MTASETERLRFPCRSCGETLFTRALVCPHCGASDPAGEPPEPSFEPLAPRRVVVDVPAVTPPPPEAPTPAPASAGAVAPGAARLWPEAGETAGDAPAAAIVAGRAPAAPPAAAPVAGDPAVEDAAAATSADAYPEDLAPVVWRSAAAARAEPLAAAPEPTLSAADDAPPPLAATGTAAAAPAGDTGAAADGSVTRGPAATVAVPGDAAAITAASPATDAHDVRAPGAKPTADRFDEMLAVSAAEAGDDGEAVAGALPDDLVHGEAEPPRRASPEARLDIAPRRGGSGDDPPVRDLVLVPERGGRELGPLRRRTPRMLAGSLLILLFVAIGAAGALFWRQLSPIVAEGTAVAAAEPAREVVVGRAWVPLALDGAVPAGGWSISASGPFRIRVGGAVYTVAGPVPFAVPLAGGNVEIRAVADDVTLTISGRR